jgi:hypothetical protein
MQYILIVGDPKVGHQAFGPFWSEKSAEDFYHKNYVLTRYEIIPLNVGL